MLARTAPAPFSDPRWLFEAKYDGYRLIAARRAKEVELHTRRGLRVRASYPEVVRAVAGLEVDAVLDGELVVLDPDGRTNFQRLQQRAGLTSPADVARVAPSHPVALYAFDLLGVDGLDLRTLPLELRKDALRILLETKRARDRALLYASHIEGEGEAAYREAQRLGLEGLMAKRRDCPYRSGRSDLWLKLPLDLRDDFIIVGYTAPRGSRTGLGALHLATVAPLDGSAPRESTREGSGPPDGAALRYAGKVGTGFSAPELMRLKELLRPIPKPAVEIPPPLGRGDVWVVPEHLCEVRYKGWTGDRRVRQPVYLGLRPDKEVPVQSKATPRIESPDATEGSRPRAERPDATNGSRPRIESPGAPKGSRPRTTSHKAPEDPRPRVQSPVTLSRPDKVLFPRSGFTKADVAGYYRAIAPWLLPYLADRPVALTRYPDGIDGKWFFQKDVPQGAPSWLRTVAIRGEGGERTLRYVLIDDADGLEFLANLAVLPLHLWSSRVTRLERPDWAIIDLDPKGAPFADVLKLARAVRALCSSLGLSSHCKTSGQAGLHILIPLGGTLDHAQAVTLSQLLATVIARKHPTLATVERTIAARQGRVYLDYLQNGRGKLLASPFCVRPIEGARVSMPLRWSEVTARLRPEAHDIRSAPARMRRLGEDPMASVLLETPDLPEAFARLEELLAP